MKVPILFPRVILLQLVQARMHRAHADARARLTASTQFSLVRNRPLPPCVLELRQGRGEGLPSTGSWKSRAATATGAPSPAGPRPSPPGKPRLGAARGGGSTSFRLAWSRRLPSCRKPLPISEGRGRGASCYENKRLNAATITTLRPLSFTYQQASPPS